MPRKLDGTFIESGTITITQLSGSVNETSNAAYGQANLAYDQANTAYGQANAARSDTNTTFATLNTTFGTVNTNIGTAYTQANSARSDANTTFATVNTSFGTLNTTFGTVNTSLGTVNTAVTNAHNQANAAFNAANGKLSLTGGTIVGDITVTGNLFVNGTETIVNTSSLTINDPIFLLANNNTTNAVGIGFVGHYGPTQQHAGLIRAHQDNNWYLFENYDSHILYANNVLDTANIKLATLRANVNANSLLLVGNSVATQANLTLAHNQANVAYGQANAAYGQANSAYGAANNRVLKAGDTMTGSLTLGAGRTVGSGGIVLSYTGLNTDIVANGRTSGISTGWGTFRIHQEAGNPGLIIAGEANQTAPFIRVQNSAESGLLVFSNTGNLGIGTTSPGVKLNVVGGRTDLTANNETYALGVRYGSSAGIYYIGATNSATPDLIFSQVGGAERMRLTNGGELAIGGTDASGTVTAIRSFGNSAAINFCARAAGTAQGQLAGYSFYPTFVGTGDNGPRRAADIWAGFNAGAWGTQYLAFGVGSDVNDTANTTPERMRITSAGNVGIGTDAPSAKLTVSGGYINQTNGTVTTYIGADGSGGSLVGTSTNHYFRVIANNIERARFSAAGGFSLGTTADPGTGAIFATGNITAYYSDARLKEFKGKIKNALDKVGKLNGYYYVENKVAAQYGYTNKEEQVGVSAQEVEAVLPHVVAKAPFDIAQDENGNQYSVSGEDYKTVRYERLVPLLIEAIKELKAEIEVLKQK